MRKDYVINEQLCSWELIVFNIFIELTIITAFITHNDLSL